MKITEFKRNDGTTGKNYKPEHNDVIKAKVSTIFVSEPRAVIVNKGTPEERAVNIVSRGIKAEWNGEEIFCNLTEGQTKNLSKTTDLTDKEILFENYESNSYGTLIGARVK